MLENKIITKIKSALHMVYKAGDNTVEHDGIEHAGFLSFMAILSLFPFLVFFVAILGGLGETEKGAELIHLLLDKADGKIVAAIAPTIDEILNGPPQALLTISIIGAIWTSSSMVEGLRTTLNRAYRVHTPPNYWLRRLFSIGQIIMLTIILLIAMFMLVIGPLAFEKVIGFFESFNATTAAVGVDTKVEIDTEGFEFLGIEWKTYRLMGIFGIILFFVSSLYYFLPNVKQSWRKTLPGALICVAGWIGLGKAFSYYLSNFDRLNLIYGSLGSIIAFLIFFYLLNVIFIYGAEFNYLLEKSMGGRIEEREKVKKKDIKPKEEHNRDDDELKKKKSKKKKK